MSPEDAMKKIEEIKALGKKESGIGYLAAAVGWLLKDRMDQLVEQVTSGSNRKG